MFLHKFDGKDIGGFFLGNEHFNYIQTYNWLRKKSFVEVLTIDDLRWVGFYPSLVKFVDFISCLCSVILISGSMYIKVVKHIYCTFEDINIRDDILVYINKI